MGVLNWNLEILQAGSDHGGMLQNQWVRVRVGKSNHRPDAFRPQVLELCCIHWCARAGDRPVNEPTEV